jgi:ribosomal protein S18 acetylase RimI-like enzyme
MRIAAPSSAAEVDAAAHLFDGPPEPDATARFLADESHHLLLAYDENDRPIGMVTGVAMTHPDKGTEMFLYELGVDETARGAGVGTALIQALAGRARKRGCYGMWVCTDLDNVAAQRAYRKAGATDQDTVVSLSWTF